MQLKIYSDVFNYTNRLVATDNCFINSLLSLVKILNKKKNLYELLMSWKLLIAKYRVLFVFNSHQLLEKSVSSPSNIVEINSVVDVTTFT